MMRTQAVKLTRAPFRQFTAAAIRRAEGDTGATRAGGAATGLVSPLAILHSI